MKPVHPFSQRAGTDCRSPELFSVSTTSIHQRGFWLYRQYSGARFGFLI